MNHRRRRDARDANRRNAIKAYGTPDGKRPQGCPNKWKRLGVRIVTADFGGGPPCAATTPVQQVVVTGRSWSTERGLKVGDSLDRVRSFTVSPYGAGD